MVVVVQAGACLASRKRPSPPPFFVLPFKTPARVDVRSHGSVPEASQPMPPTPKPASSPKIRPALSLKKGQIVRVDKEKYLNSVEYLAVGHPPNYKGLDYIYEDRGEVLDVRLFETGEYALISWIGIPTSPAWLPTYMLIKVEKHSYKRM